MRLKLALVLAGAGMLIPVVPMWAHHAFAAEFNQKTPLNCRASSPSGNWSIPIPGFIWT